MKDIALIGSYNKDKSLFLEYNKAFVFSSQKPENHIKIESTDDFNCRMFNSASK